MNDLTSDDQTSDDRRLLDELAAALRSHEEVPDRHREAAQGAFTWRTVDVELMELSYDSLDAPRTVRGAVGTAPRALSFASSAGSLEVEVDGDRVRGHVVPAAAVTVRMRNASGERAEARSDEGGMFVLMGVLPGPVRFEIEGDVAGTTSWVTI